MNAVHVKVSVVNDIIKLTHTITSLYYILLFNTALANIETLSIICDPNSIPKMSTTSIFSNTRCKDISCKDCKFGYKTNLSSGLYTSWFVYECEFKISVKRMMQAFPLKGSL